MVVAPKNHTHNRVLIEIVPVPPGKMREAYKQKKQNLSGMGMKILQRLQNCRVSVRKSSTDYRTVGCGYKSLTDYRTVVYRYKSLREVTEL